MTVQYEYDEEAASRAEDGRIDFSAAFIGKFKRAWHVISGGKGTQGVKLEFEAPGAMTTLTLWTYNGAGEKLPDYNRLAAFQTLFSLKGLKSRSGMVPGYDDEGKRIEEKGEIFPDLCDKPIGLILQREDYTREDTHKDSWRLNILCSFHPSTKLTASEIREGKTEAKKYERILRGLKDKDSRTAGKSEPSQPSQGAGVPEGGY